VSNRIGERYSVLVFGQSHAPSIGCVIEGLPAGFKPDMDRVLSFMARRAPNGGALSTARKEADIPEILSGLNERGETCGAPLCMRIVNGDHRSKDYDALRDVPRPGHADYTAHVKYRGANDIRGGGQFSGRLTAPLCFAGALAMQLLAPMGIRVAARVRSIAGIEDAPMDMLRPDLDAISSDDLPVTDAERGRDMRAAIAEARAEGDSVGGVIECFATGVPAGLGEPMFGGVENKLAGALFGIPAVRGVEFGLGFAAAGLRGSRHNDGFAVSEDKGITALSNNHGGILGGITSGMPLVVRAAFKPTPSIGLPQRSVSLSRGTDETLSVAGRHDPCIVPRAVPVVEAVAAIVIYDLILTEGSGTSWS